MTDATGTDATTTSQIRSAPIRRRWWAWALLGCTAVVLLAAGAARDVTTGASDDRLFEIAAQMKCLQCVGESVANSQAPIAIQMRGEIRSQLSQGQTDDEIFTFFADRYGARVLLNPSANGLPSLIWIVPVVAVAAAIVGLGLAFVRWRARPSEEVEVSDEDRAIVERAQRVRRG